MRRNGTGERAISRRSHGATQGRSREIGQVGGFPTLAPLKIRVGAATSSSPWEGAWEGNGDVAAPIENRNGVAMSSSPWESARERDEDFAAPFELGVGD